MSMNQIIPRRNRNNKGESLWAQAAAPRQSWKDIHSEEKNTIASKWNNVKNGNQNNATNENHLKFNISGENKINDRMSIDAEIEDRKEEEEITNVVPMEVEKSPVLPVIFKYVTRQECDFKVAEDTVELYASRNRDRDWVLKKDEAAKFAFKETLQCMRTEREIVHRSPNDISLFLEYLKNNYLFDLGFHFSGWNPEQDKCCLCPLHRFFEEWRRDYNLFMDNCSCKKMLPSALIVHLRTKSPGGSLTDKSHCLLHFATWKYMVFLYRNVNNGKGHKALFNVGDNNYNLAVAEEIKMQKHADDLLQRENKILKKKLEEKETKRKQLEEMRKVNKDLAEKVEALEDFKEMFNIEKKEKVFVSNKEIENYKKGLSVQFETHQRLANEFLKEQRLLKNKTNNRKQSSGIQIVINQEYSLENPRDVSFDLQKFFTDKYSLTEDDTYFFRDFVKNGSPDDEAWRFMIEWDVVYNSKIKASKDDKVNATDKGGPTRAFLSDVWKQMGQLKVTGGLGEEHKNSYLNLFDRDNNSHSVVTDDYITTKINAMAKILYISDNVISKEEIKLSLMTQVKRYYRALGRIMYRAIASNNEILETIMPNFYLNVIFRGINPMMEEYELGDILDDLFSGEDAKEMKKFFEAQVPEYIRENIHENFYKGKEIAISSIREGLCLNGHAKNLTLNMRAMPVEAVRRCFFAKNKITANELIGVLVADYTEVKNTMYYERCKRFFEHDLKNFIRYREVAKNEKFTGNHFMRSFVAFATGSHHIPYDTSFKISVEFNPHKYEQGMDRGPMALPVAHTCERTLKLPGDIYRSGEDFGKKLDMAMNYCANSFNMA